MLSVHVGDGVEDAYAEAQRRGYEIVHPLTLEPWGVRRFFVRDPDGNVINVVSHSEDRSPAIQDGCCRDSRARILDCEEALDKRR